MGNFFGEHKTYNLMVSKKVHKGKAGYKFSGCKAKVGVFVLQNIRLDLSGKSDLSTQQQKHLYQLLQKLVANLRDKMN